MKLKFNYRQLIESGAENEPCESMTMYAPVLIEEKRKIIEYPIVVLVFNIQATVEIFCYGPI